MPVELLPFGEPYQDINPDHLTIESARRTLSACINNDSFEVVELCRLNASDGGVADVIIVACINDQVPSRNNIGIKVREQLALVFYQNKIPEVRALRKDFPKVPHLNYVPPAEPSSLCLYFQNWSAVERTWTPQKHLQRIIWWLAETAKNSLHREDQPLENIYFDSPFEIVLPPDYDEKILNPDLDLTYVAISTSEHDFRVIRGFFVPKGEAKKKDLPKIELFDIELSALVHGSADMFPNSLGTLNEYYQSRGVPFFDHLVAQIKEKAGSGLDQDTTQRCLLIIRIPLLRAEGLAPEKVEVRAFFTALDLVALGLATGALMQSPVDKKYYADYGLGQECAHLQDKWGHHEILPVELKPEVDRSRARLLSGVQDENLNIQCALMGVGALGGAIAELTSKAGWGSWTYIDPDIVKAHNIVRHVSKNGYIGWFKAEAVKSIVEKNYHVGYYSATAVNDSAINFSNGTVLASLTSSSLNIDATTTLEVPREISQLSEVSRSASVFITPSGRDAVLLIEDENRDIRLDSLEAQYYRAVLNSDWGSKHLAGHKGNLWVGAGCRDVSLIISYESILLAAAAITRQIRVLQSSPAPGIVVWTNNDVDSSFIVQAISVSPTRKEISDGWTVVLDQHIEERLKEMRLAQLPNETGGIIIGYVDQKLRAIYVVDVLSAPYDSEADYSGFTRGVEGLDEALVEIANRTGNIVGYIGEWHSHPEFASANPSSLDWQLIDKLSSILAIDAQPALMMIVGSDGDLSITVKSWP